MDLNLVLNNFLNPAILFFFLGIAAVYIKSDLEIPQPLPKFLSLYLLFSIGFKGGTELSHSGWDSQMVIILILAIAMSIAVPIYAFYILKKKINTYDAGALAATYGSISAVTIITATSFLHDLGVEYGGYMVAAMALMESPSIIVGVMLIRLYNRNGNNHSYGEIAKEAFSNGSVVMILGSLVIGMLTDENQANTLAPFTDNIFKGMLTFFLLDMGLLAGKRLKALKKTGAFLITFSIIVPIFNALVGILLCYIFKIEPGNALLLVVLFGSASYIAVPAAMRLSVPEANPGLYVPLSLAITFPFNIIIGIPMYYYLINLMNG